MRSFISQVYTVFTTHLPGYDKFIAASAYAPLMKTIFVLYILLLAVEVFAQAQKQIPNRSIDYKGFLRDAAEVGKLRQERRVTEEQFLRMAYESGTIIFDARSREKYQLLHLKGATHLSLPDITATELEKAIPSKGTRVLIYCNNNFENETNAFPAKVASVALNIYTFNTLYGYGYTNVYELGPLIDITKSKLPLEGSRMALQR
jgi:phage shock protein E